MNVKPENIRPTDLIRAEDAAVVSARSKSSIRTWVRLGKLTGYKEDPRKQNSALMVSKSELIAFLAMNKSPEKPKQTGRQPYISASVDKLRTENKDLEMQLRIAQQKIQMLERLMSQTEEMSTTQKKAIDATERRNMELRADNNLLKEEIGHVRARLDQFSFENTIPWWRRIDRISSIADRIKSVRPNFRSHKKG